MPATRKITLEGTTENFALSAEGTADMDLRFTEDIRLSGIGLFRVSTVMADPKVVFYQGEKRARFKSSDAAFKKLRPPYRLELSGEAQVLIQPFQAR